MILGISIDCIDKFHTDTSLEKIIADSHCTKPVPIEFCRQQGDFTDGSLIVVVLCDSYRRRDHKVDVIFTVGDLKGTVAKLVVTESAQGMINEVGSIGHVFLLLNPQTSFDMFKGMLQIRVDKQTQIIRIGRAKYFGICPAVKSDGTRCRMAIDVSSCNECIYHARASEISSTKRDLSKSINTNSIADKNSIPIPSCFYSTNSATKDSLEQNQKLTVLPRRARGDAYSKIVNVCPSLHEGFDINAEDDDANFRSVLNDYKYSYDDDSDSDLSVDNPSGDTPVGNCSVLDKQTLKKALLASAPCGAHRKNQDLLAPPRKMDGRVAVPQESSVFLYGAKVLDQERKVI